MERGQTHNTEDGRRERIPRTGRPCPGHPAHSVKAREAHQTPVETTENQENRRDHINGLHFLLYLLDSLPNHAPCRRPRGAVLDFGCRRPSQVC